MTTCNTRILFVYFKKYYSIRSRTYLFIMLVIIQVLFCSINFMEQEFLLIYKCEYILLQVHTGIKLK